MTEPTSRQRQVAISLARGMLFRVIDEMFIPHKSARGLNLSCESNAFQGKKIQAAVKGEVSLNLSCESNAFQGYLNGAEAVERLNVLISLARVKVSYKWIR